MLKANVISVIFSVVITLLTILIIHNLTIAVVSIVIIFAFRCCYAELLLLALLECNLHKYMLQEIIMVSLFMLTAWFVGGAIGATLYVSVLIIYFVYNRHNITWAIKLMSNK